MTRYRQILPTYVLVALFLALLGACSSEAPERRYQEGQRTVQPLNQGWKFILSEPEALASAPENKWKDVTLPHTWNAKDGQNGGDDYYRGTGVYQRLLKLDDNFQGKQLYLHFDGAAISTRVYVNGQVAGNHKGSYGAFRFDVTDLAKPGENTLEVHVNNAIEDHVAPLSADFTFFGGLYRKVRLIATEPIHIDTMDHASSGVFWSQDSIQKDRAKIGLRTALVNHSGKAETLSVVAQLVAHDGTVASQAVEEFSLASGQTLSLQMQLELAHPRLWHGRKDPYLYRATLSVIRGEDELDSRSENLGLRFFHVDPDAGFFLNGESYPLRGINRMPDFPNKGTAVSEEDHERDLQLMLELGATSVRLGHQQRDSWVYRRADELGLLVWAEIPLINRIQDSTEFSTNLKQQALELIRQNYNRASIVIWGLYNEITLKSGPNPRPLVEELNQLVKAEDPNRLTSAAVAAEGGLHDSLVTTPDLISFNRYDGWYYGNFGHFAEFLDTTREEGPQLRVGISEYGAGASIKPAFQTDSPIMQDHSEQYQALYHEAYWEALVQRPWVWGQYIWVLADFAVDNRNEGDSPGRNDKGLVSYDRKVKKDAFYWYKANWSDEPVLYITGRRLKQRNRNQVDIKVYSNQAEVELLVNGESMGKRKKGSLPRFIWENVPLTMGGNTVEAMSSTAGKTLRDKITLTRVNSNSTILSSTLLGIDTVAGKIYNPPHGATLESLSTLLTIPDEGQITQLGPQEDGKLEAGMTLQVIAQDGATQQDYQLEKAPISVAKPVWASSEIASDISIGPLDIPEMSASKANDGIVKESSEGLTDVNIWNTMGGSSHWWKVDLGAEYYLDSIEIVWPQHSSLIEPGPMQYSVETAKQFEQTFDVFAETYTELVDRRDNSQSGTTSDPLGTVGRFVRVRLHNSGILAKTPMIGDYPVFGAEEITVRGGLLYSNELKIDYKQRTVALPGSDTAASIMAKLGVVGEGSLVLLDPTGAALELEDALQGGELVIASDGRGNLAEKYLIEMK